MKTYQLVVTAGALLALGTVGMKTATAKTTQQVVSNRTMTTPAATRNVAPTGRNALYSKAGFMQSKKTVASTATMKRLATSTKSKDYFRVYQIATTNKGAVYYKMVSFDGKYRGWVYGGRTAGRFAGGLKAAKTTQQAPLPLVRRGYKLGGGGNDLWNAPQWTQYQAAKRSWSGYKAGDTFVIRDAVTKTREGSLYYLVTDERNSAVHGWIYAAGLEAPTEAQPEMPTTTTTYVTVVYKDSAGQTVGNYLWNIPEADFRSHANKVAGARMQDVLNTTVSLWDVAKQNVPAGHTFTSSSTPEAEKVVLGGTFTITVK